MSCFPCFGSKDTEDEQSEVPVAQVIDTTPTTAPAVNNPSNQSTDGVSNGADAVENNGSRTFTFRELLMATKNFKQECLIGEGGFGKLYKGKLQSGEVVAVKHLDRNGAQGNKEFLVEVLILTLLNHPNLVKLIGYCADGEQRLIVYEYMSSGSLDTHLHDIADEKKPLDWQTRMKIASGVAQGLEYLHEKANPPIFYHDLKPVNILLDEDHNARLSGYGLAKLVNGDTKTHAAPRVMGTYGYCAPEYERQGELTVKSDVYSFGVILLELITGRRALDTTRPKEEQTLVSWAQPLFRDQKKYPDMADPLLEGQFPQKSLNQAIGMVAMCLQEEPSVRPLMSDVVSMLGFLEVTPPEEAKPASLEAASLESGVDEHDNDDEKDSSSSDDESDENSVGSENDNEEHPEDQNENIPNGSQNFEKQGSSSQHEMEENPGNKSHNSLSSDDESDRSSVSSENDDGDHPKDQMEYIPNQSQNFEKQGSSSQHKMEANLESKSRNSNERECSQKYDGNEESIDNSSMGRNSMDETSEHNSMENKSSGAPQGGHVSMNLRQNSIEESQGGSINSSSIGHGRYEEESFVWSSGSSSDCQLNDGSARRNSGHMNNVGLSMRQQSIPNA